MLIPTYLINSNHFKNKNSNLYLKKKKNTIQKQNFSAFEWYFLIISDIA